jgi:hypothetical protein
MRLMALLGLWASLHACGSQPVLINDTEPFLHKKAAEPANPENVPNFALKRRVDTRPPIPIFIITCDRITWLKRTLAGLDRAIDRPIDVVIHDNHSTFPAMVAYLAALERQGITVVRNPPISEDTELNRVAQTVEAWYLFNDAPYYAITDPDIELDAFDGKILDFYAELLDKYKDVTVVGPLLRYDDLPDHYPFKSQIIANETRRHSENPPTTEDFKGEAFQITRGAIDTTFGLYRKTFAFRRVNPAIEVFPPYAARHLDWYLDPKNLTSDQEYYMRTANKITNSDATWLRQPTEDEQEQL